ncbi:SnoaL-like domain protein [Burkholderia pseudomallei]|uniref:nuclear transport factor 2 family protein n=1 Tax=Burkholderia pseudomallei TaxID=28450 RepID=UPI00070652E0|nr:nuclear transport factor 2 family protein [Burkholderia pseudomallei]ALJ74602.1 SnoaL-like domain protein [Burkholderia pseudomallei]
MEPITQAFAQQFGREWIDAWNAHDLDRVLSHYADAFEMSSPMIVQIAGEPSGRLCGKDQVGAYWLTALRMIPALHFEWIATLAGVDSVAIHYRGANGRLALEVFHFGPDRRVVKAFAHYAE